MGPLLCLVSAACFGAMAVFGKLAYAEGVSPDALLLIRFCLAAVILGAASFLRPGRRRRPGGDIGGGTDGGRGTGADRRRLSGGPGRRSSPSAAVVLTAILLGAVGYAAQAGLYFAALQRMDASLLSLLLYTYPLMVTVAAAALGRDRLTRRRCVALLVASGGTVLVLLGAGGGRFDGWGALLAVGSAATYTVYILVADTVVDRISPVALSALVMAGAAGTFAVRAALSGGVGLGFGPAGWWWLACIAVVSTVLAMLTFFAGLARTGPSTAAILSTFEPVVTTTLATLVLGDLLTPLQLAGGLLVLAAVVVLQVRTGGPPSSAPSAAGQSPAHDREPLPDRTSARGRA
jgi:drug/metabolite transporter (DMT)-like permease